MKKICRLTIAYAHRQTDGNVRAVLQKHMDKCGVAWGDIEATSRESYGGKTHFGNWVLTPVQDNEASRKLADSMGTELDMHRYVIEPDDLTGLKPGDKVQVQVTNCMAIQVKDKGIVVRVGPDFAVVRKYKTRNKGWNIQVGDESAIWRGW